jgi:hypothetical protein
VGRAALTTIMLGVLLLAPACSGSRWPPLLRHGTTGSAHTFFVAPTGRDTNPGTVVHPFATFMKAMSVLRPGDALYARGGTYVQRVKATALVPGALGRRILVANFPGERPVIHGMFWLAYPSYWTIDGINVTWDAANPNQHMVQIYGGTNWVLEHAEIWGAHSYAGLLIGDGERNNLGQFTVRDNCIHDTYPTNGANEDHDVYIDDTTHSPNVRGLIERNIIYGARNGRGIKLGPPDPIGGPTHLVIQYNTIAGAYQDVSFSRAASNNLLTRNLLVNARQANVGTYLLYGKNNVVRNNAGFGAPRFADPGVVIGTGNKFPLNPRFDSVGCRGFHPSNPVAKSYGRYAIAALAKP